MKTGIFTQAANDYHATKALSHSMLKELKKSPKALSYYMANPITPTPAMLLGTLTHTLVLEPDNFTDEFAVFEGKVRRGKAWDDFQAANQGKIIIKQDELDDGRALADQVRSNPIVAKAIEGAEIEKSVFWTDKETGTFCKARPDLIKNDILFDLKTTMVQDLNDFSREVYNRSYYTQAAHYMAGYEAATGKKARGFVLLAVSKSAPFDSGSFVLNSDYIALGRETIRPLIDQYAECVTSNSWPGFSDKAVNLEPPAWS